MRNLKALYLTLLLWISCSESEEMPAGTSRSLLLVIENQWKVALYRSDGQDLTASSGQMLFHFLDSGIVRVDNEDESYTGSWNLVRCASAETGEESHCLDLDFTLDSNPYDILLPDGLWLVESFSSDLLTLTLPEQKVAGDTRLILERLK